MTVKQLKDKLKNFPDHMEVYVADRKTEFAYGLLNSVTAREISFVETPDADKVLAKDTVVILDEE